MAHEEGPNMSFNYKAYRKPIWKSIISRNIRPKDAKPMAHLIPSHTTFSWKLIGVYSSSTTISFQLMTLNLHFELAMIPKLKLGLFFQWILLEEARNKFYEIKLYIWIYKIHPLKWPQGWRYHELGQADQSTCDMVAISQNKGELCETGKRIWVHLTCM